MNILTNITSAAINVCSGLENSNLCDIPSFLQPVLDNLNLNKGGPSINTLTRLISFAASIFLAIVVASSVISILLAAWNMITDNGDGVNFKKGTMKFFYAIGGLIFALLSFAIVSFVIAALGKSR